MTAIEDSHHRRTGNQGGAVARALEGAVLSARPTRTPDSERVAELARHGVDVVKGDLDDGQPAPCVYRRVGRLRRAERAGGGRAPEEAQGKRLATLAREAGVEALHAPCDRRTSDDIPTSTASGALETVRGLRLPRM
jgi:hypothetical protein